MGTPLRGGLMVRRSVPAHATDDRYFPARVRIAVPPGGLGNQLDMMHGWLNMHAGRDNFAIRGANNDLRVDAAFFYFVDVTIAKAFVERFACGLAVIERGHRGAD